MLQQALQNLALNAYQAMPGGGRLRIAGRLLVARRQCRTHRAVAAAATVGPTLVGPPGRTFLMAGRPGDGPSPAEPPLPAAPPHASAGSGPAVTGVEARPLVRVQDVSKTFDVSPPWLNRVLERKPRLLLRAVDGVSFDIAAGETLALVGESGCGKSTVARLLVGLYAPSSGRIEFDGHDLSATAAGPASAARRRMQMIFQDPYASLNPRWEVSRIVSEPLRVQDASRSPSELRDRVAALLGQVGLSPSDGSKYPHQFSGGQRQRISIARALASQPEFIVCDEPTSALDVSVQAQVLNLMRDLQRTSGLTYLFISHNLAVVHHVSDRVGVMYLGRIVELAPKATLFAQPRHPYTRMLIDAIPDIRMSGRARTPVAGEVPNPLDPPTGCAFNPRCPHANERCLRERPQLMQLADKALVACHAVQEGRLPSSP
jgi:peptide/nickel transport system ATP-binding protein